MRGQATGGTHKQRYKKLRPESAGKSNGSARSMSKSKANKMGAEGPKRSVAGGMGSVTRPTPGGGRKRVGPNKSKAALKAVANEGRKPTKKK